ncbi:MAG TPA: YbjQ family protein [Terriglobia bacterium]
MEIHVTTSFNIEGFRITSYKGIARGIVVRSPTIGQSLFGDLKSVIGGNIGAYTEMCEQAREQAYQLMVRHALDLGANALIGVRYDAAEVVAKQSATEVLCYGTAVVVEREK